MEQKTYSLMELEGLAAMLSDMLKQSLVFLQQAEDMKQANPWLAPAIATLANNPFCYVEMAEHGGGSAKFDGNSAIFEITLPTECITDGEHGRWGDTMPIEFHFTKTGHDEYVFDKAFSNESRCAKRNS